MSALDQAFIKAYAKDNVQPPQRVSSTAAVAHDVATAPSPAAAVPTAYARPAAPMLEQLYADGVLYRHDAPTTDAATGRLTAAAPHFAPASRSVARRLAKQAQGGAMRTPAAVLPPAAAPPPRPPQRQLLSRGVLEIARRLLREESTANDETAEASPEILVQPAPKPLETAPTSPLQNPVASSAWPASTPLNVVVQSDWNPSDSVWSAASQTLLPSVADWQTLADSAILRLDLPVTPAAEPPAPKRSFRLDPPQAEVRAPHAPQPKPAAPAETPSQEAEPILRMPEPEVVSPPVAEPPVAAEPVSAIEAPAASLQSLANAVAQPAVEPLIVPVAEIVAETSIPQPRVEAPAVVPIAEAVAAPIVRKPCIPVWEVDEFLWPKTCDQLLNDDNSYFAEAGEKLAAAVHDGLKSLAITGSRRGEGRTTLALCLARAAAREGISVAVVDADFARPQLAATIGLEVSCGWQDAALGMIPLSEAAVKSLADRITVLPLEASAAGSELSLADPRVTATLRALSATFELVLVDLGPLSAGDEPLFPADEACPIDAAVVVRDLRYASLSETQAIGETLYAAGLAAVGVAENFLQPKF